MDDELALVNGFKNDFKHSVHLLCKLHLQKNTETKLKGLNISGEVKREFMADIFGQPLRQSTKVDLLVLLTNSNL